MNDLIVVEKIAEWQKLKALVLDSVSSPITRRVYNMALEEFLAWLQDAPRNGFTSVAQACSRSQSARSSSSSHEAVQIKMGTFAVAGSVRTWSTICQAGAGGIRTSRMATSG